MSLMTATCALMLQAGPVTYAAPVEASPFANVSVSDNELASVRGMGLDPVGLSQVPQARNASTITIASFGPRVSDTVREITDNWILQVATPLIAAAAAS